MRWYDFCDFGSVSSVLVVKDGFISDNETRKFDVIVCDYSLGQELDHEGIVDILLRMRTMLNHGGYVIVCEDVILHDVDYWEDIFGKAIYHIDESYLDTLAGTMIWRLI